MVDLGPERGHRRLGAVLVDEAEPHAQRHDDGDDHRVGATAGQSGHQRRPQQQDEDRVPDLAQQHRPGPHLMGGQDVVAEPAEPRRGLDGRQARPAPARASTASPGAIRAVAARSSSTAGAPPPVDGGRTGRPVPAPVAGPTGGAVTTR